MLDVVVKIVYIVAVCWLVLCGMGYVFYKWEKLGSWTEGLNFYLKGMKKLICSFFRFFYEQWNGLDLQQEQIRTERILTNQEMLHLVDELNGCPYAIPSIETYIPNASGILWADISAVELAPSYRQIPEESIKEITGKVIQNFYMKSRETKVPLYIKVATAHRLYFAIALSERGREFLDRQEMEKEISSPEETIDLFTEEIPEEENTHDFRL